MESNRKYKLIRTGIMDNRLNGVAASRLYQVQALRDIPEYGVTAGDLGGYVKSKTTLSHLGSCWIAGDAQALENVFIKENAYVGNDAVLDGQGGLSVTVKGSAMVIEKATVTAWVNPDEPNGSAHSTVLSGKFQISGTAFIRNLKSGSGNAKVYDNAFVAGASEIIDNAMVYGNSTVKADVKIVGASKVYGDASIGKGATLINSTVCGNAKVSSYMTYTEAVLSGDNTTLAIERSSVASTPKMVEQLTPVAASSPMLDEYNEIMADIDAYGTDIVKIIKYPVMTDSTDPHTLNMVLALKKARRLSRNPETPEFAEAVENLEEKFTIAESNALKTASTLLTESEQKKVQLAKDLLAVASNDSSTENEKKVSFRQAFKQLEGVIAVPEIAVDTFRIKIGLQELEAL